MGETNMNDSRKSMESIDNSNKTVKLVDNDRPRNSAVCPVEGCTCPKPIFSPYQICGACWYAFHGIAYDVANGVEGETLKDKLDKGPLEIDELLNAAMQVAEGLDEAHRKGIIHRDLKPSNIMIDREGSARIMDFGIARSVEGKDITGAGVMIGTPEYMSPEQVEGKEIDQRSDIYSLGVILYEMVTGRVPFEGDTPFTVGMKHKSEIPADPKELNTQIPEDLSHVILKCLEKDKEKRYQNAGDVRNELKRIEEGMPTAMREIPKKKPLTSREITVTVGLKKLVVPTLVVLVLVIAAVIIWQFLSKKDAAPLPTGKPSLAIMYFKNNTGDESLDHWRTMLSNLLIADLTQSKHLRVLGEDRLYNILSELDQVDADTYSSEVLNQVASQGRVNHIIQGAYAKAGAEFRINVMLHDASTGELIGSESVAGVGESSIFTMVDDLTRRIKTNFRLSQEEIKRDIDQEVGAITTSSPEALKYYTEGRMQHNKGNYRKSIELMQKAVSIDSEFAMAYRSMANASGNLYLFSEKKKYLQKALDLKDRLSEREQLIIEGDFYYDSENTYDKAIEVYNKLLRLYPDDFAASNNLGNIYSFLEEWDKAIELYKVRIDLKDDSTIPYTNLAINYRAKGMYDSANKVLEDYIRHFSDSAGIRRALAENYICQGELDLALAENDKAFDLDPTRYENTLQKGDLYVYQGHLDKAEEEYQKLSKAKEPLALVGRIASLFSLYSLQGKFEKSKSMIKQGLGLAKMIGEKWWEALLHLAFAAIQISSKNPEEALKECDEAWNIALEIENPMLQKAALTTRGHALLEMGLLDEAQKAVDKLNDMIEKSISRNQKRDYYELMGLIELERGNFSRSIEYLENAVSLMRNQMSSFFDDQAFYVDSLALAYYRYGELTKALREYERVTSLTTGRLHYGDIYVKSFYMLGKIYEEKGDDAKAMENYETYLELLKDADPGIAEVEDAKVRLSGLKGQ